MMVLSLSAPDVCMFCLRLTISSMMGLSLLAFSGKATKSKAFFFSQFCIDIVDYVTLQEVEIDQIICI